MAINFNCSSCGKAIAVPDKMAGRSGKCPSCGTRLTVPGGGAGGPKTGTGVRKKKTTAATGVAIPVDQDGIATVIDGMPPGAADEAVAVPVPVDDDEFAIPEPVEDIPDVVDVAPIEDDFDDLPEPGGDDFDDDLPEPEPEDVPSAAAVVARTRAGKGTGRAGRRGRTEDADSGGPRTRAQRLADARAEKKKGGGFLWFLFGLILALAHTAGAALLGAMIVIGYAEGDKTYEFMEQPAQILGIDQKLRELRGDEADHDHDHDHTGRDGDGHDHDDDHADDDSLIDDND